MSIRKALRRQSFLASGKRGKERAKPATSNTILAIAVGLFALVCAIEILHG